MPFIVQKINTESHLYSLTSKWPTVGRYKQFGIVSLASLWSIYPDTSLKIVPTLHWISVSQSTKVEREVQTDLLTSLTSSCASAQTLKRLQEGALRFVFLHSEQSFLIHLLGDFITAECSHLPQDGPGPVAMLSPGQSCELRELLHFQRHPVSGKSIQVTHFHWHPG